MVQLMFYYSLFKKVYDQKKKTPQQVSAGRILQEQVIKDLLMFHDLPFN